MSTPRYSIGIDLGTTNCALSYVDLADVDAVSQVFEIPQLERAGALVERTSLPSFLYRPRGGERLSALGEGMIGAWAVGVFAREQSILEPDRVAYAAKSWLCHHAVSVESKILPWGSAELDGEEKISPLAASSMLLSYLRTVWNLRFETAAESFDLQEITITVPASFDAASQGATLEAARLAGYPASTRLLEEPQAAFFRWLENADTQEIGPGDCILVVDVGGGTSDFSLFRVVASEEGKPLFERIAVSDHILLGGDNIDLALAHALESELSKDPDEELSSTQWNHLIARARALKERCLAAEGDEEEILSVSVPSAGSGLLAGTLSAQFPSAAAREMLLEGFFPPCKKTDTPIKPSSALQEWGLPYAPDFAVTRYLAAFLFGKPSVDALLFNGGTLAAPLLRQRLVEQVTEWQEGGAPRILENRETDLAVARGAAVSGSLRYRKERRIRAGAARSIYLELASLEGGFSSYLCVLPKGTQPEVVVRVEVPGLQLAVNQLCRFQAAQGAHDCADEAGARVAFDARKHFPLPPLESRLDSNAGEQRIPVFLESQVNEIGLLEVAVVSQSEAVEGRWSLNFNLRSVGAISSQNHREQKRGKEIELERIEKAEAGIRSLVNQRNLSPSKGLKELERQLGAERQDWDVYVLRRLGDALLENVDGLKSLSEARLSISGYLMRPGFGAARDAERIQKLWSVLEESALDLSKAESLQALILWRRLAGGLTFEQQRKLFETHFDLLRSPKGVVAERIRLLGSLELLHPSDKSKLVDWLLARAKAEAEMEGARPTACFAALGGLLSRALFRAGPEYVLSPAWVGVAFEHLSKLDWKSERFAGLVPLFLRAARIVDERSLNIPKKLSRQIQGKLKKAGVSEARLLPLQGYFPLTKADQDAAYGEALPPGLLV